MHDSIFMQMAYSFQQHAHIALDQRLTGRILFIMDHFP